MKEILYNKLKNSNSTSIVDFDSPSWAYKQAFNLGKQEAYEEITRLIDLTSDQEKE